MPAPLGTLEHMIEELEAKQAAGTMEGRDLAALEYARSELAAFQERVRKFDEKALPKRTRR